MIVNLIMNFLNERKLKYINKKRSHNNNSDDSDEENLTSRKEKLQSESNKRFKILNIKTNIPTTYQQAINSPESEEWKEAIDDELKNMYDNNVMKVVKNIPADANIIGTKWVFAEKDKKKKKARLVALGCQQIAGEDFIETYSPTVQADSLRLTVAIASKFNWDLKQLDIKAAYLNADLEEKIYTKIPYGDKKV